MKGFVRALASAVLLAALSPARAEEPPPPPSVPEGTVVVRRWLALDRVDEGGRHPFAPNAVYARCLLDPDAAPPAEGEEVVGSSGSAKWRVVESAADGTLESARGMAFATTLEVPAARVSRARLEGAAFLFVNGEGFVGDVYRQGSGPVPVALRAGANRLLVTGVRGPWRLALEPVPQGPTWPAEDVTAGDFVRGAGPQRVEFSCKVVNPSLRWEGSPLAPGSALPPLGVGKALLACSYSPPPEAAPQQVEVASGAMLRNTDPGAPRRVSFRSSVDDSVQCYGYLPETEGTAFEGPVGTVLSLHGAGVDALGQAAAYGAKTDFRVVAPSNRRAFGFDWQDWGRRDAYEALEDAARRFRIDPNLVFLTGHSMGGHGAWHLAANDPDRFAAVAPSAGWRSFDTYHSQRPATPLSPLWRAADLGGRPEDLVANLLPLPVFVLHGTADESVPVEEAQAMIDALTKVGRAPLHHLAAGKPHWWDEDPAAGADCVDWPALFDMFRRSRRPAFPDTVAFTSADPSVNRQEHWIRVEQPLLYGKPFRVEATRTASGIRVKTENCRRLRILDRGTPPAGPVVLDGQTFAADAWSEGADFLRAGDRWTAAVPDTPGEKDAWLSGPFKRAFDRRFVLVVGTKGTEEENRETLALARWHAAQWWYRANGNAPVIPDRHFLGNREAYAGRNLVLYGNEDTNAAWKSLLPPSCPVRVRRGGVMVGDGLWTGTGLGALFVHPRADDPRFLVGCVASTGPRGTRSGYGLLPFTPGVGYPDYAVFGEEFLLSGDGGVLAAGWFDHSWGLQPGGFAR